MGGRYKTTKHKNFGKKLVIGIIILFFTSCIIPCLSSSIYVFNNFNSVDTDLNRNFHSNLRAVTNDIDDSANQINIALLADPHMANKDHPLLTYDELFNDIYNDTLNFDKLDFWVALGDEALSLYDCLDGWKRAQYRYYRQVPASLILTQGNHDVYSYIREGDYPFGWHPRPYDNNLWISLNETNDIRVTHAIFQQGILFLFIGDKGEHRILTYGQKVWLEHLTSLYPNTTTVIFSHEGQRDDEHTWPSAGSYGFYNDYDWWRDFFKRNNQIELWVNGHGHNYKSPHNKHTVYYNCDPLTFILVPAFQNESEDKIGYLTINNSKMRFRLWDVSSNSFTDDWQITTSTTFNENEKGWVSFPIFLEDNETQWFDNKILSNNVILQLVGWNDPEMFGNPNLTWFDQHNDFEWLYFGNDIEEQVRQWNGETIPYGPDGEPNGVLSIDTGGFITFPHKHAIGYAPWDTNFPVLGQGGNCYSHIGCSFEMFGRQPPGAKYDILITMKTDNGTGHVNVTMNCSEADNVYKTISNSEQVVINTNVNDTYCTYQGTFMIPNENISIINGKIECDACVGVDWYNISYISIVRNATGINTKDFHLRLGNKWYNSSGILSDCEYDNFSVDILNLMNKSIVDIYAHIKGNKKGFARLIYKSPVLMARNGRFKLNNISGNGNTYNITITDKLSINNDYFYLTPLIFDYGNLQVSKGSIVKTNNNNTFSKTLMAPTTFTVTYGPIYEPSNPFPKDGATDVDLNTKLSWSGADPNPGESITYDVYFGLNIDPPLVSQGQNKTTYDPEILEYETTYYWKVVAWVNNGVPIEGPLWNFTTVKNKPPDIPTIIGPTKLKQNKNGYYKVTTKDPEGEKIYFYIDWNDGTVVDWDGPYNSDVDVIYQHNWTSKDIFIIRVKAKDIDNKESNWRELKVIIPRNRVININLYSNLFTCLTNIFPILKTLLLQIKKLG